MKEMICIEYPKTKAGKRQWGKEYGMNAIYAGKHWSRRKADSEYWHSLTIDFWWDDRLDMDNHAYMAKMIVDALKGWVIQDDNRRCVREIAHHWHDRGCILVEIRDGRD